MTIQRFQKAYDDRGPLQTLRRKELEYLCRCYNIQWTPGMKATDMRQLLQINGINPQDPQVQQKYQNFINSLQIAKSKNPAQEAKPNGNAVSEDSQEAPEPSEPTVASSDDTPVVSEASEASEEPQPTESKSYPKKATGKGREFQARPAEQLADIPVDELSYLEMKTLLSNHGISFYKTDKKNTLRQRVAEAHVNGDFA